MYKRDRDRVAEDPVLAGPIADAIAPVPDPAALWLALSQRVGVLELDSSGQRLMAAPPEFWADNALHLPQMIATGWLSLRTWQEVAGSVAMGDDTDTEAALPYLRPAVLLWLVTLGESEWAALDDLAGHLAARSPGWDSLAIAGRARRRERAGRDGGIASAGHDAAASGSSGVRAAERGAACSSRSCWARPTRSAWSAPPRSGGPAAGWCSSRR